MQRSRSLAAALVLLLLGTAAAQTDRTDDFINSQMAQFHLPGLAVAVVRNGELVKVAGYGLADRDRKIAVTPDTAFKIGSVSKQFIAAAIMLLVGDGRLALDDPVNKFLDAPPQAWAPITVRHLLTHTGGLLRESPGFNPSRARSDAEVIRAAYAAPLRFSPGQKWEYSNLGYYVLAEIIRAVTKQPWRAYLDERVFRAAGLGDTMPTDATPLPLSMAKGYTGNDNGRTADDWRALRPSGAFISTVADLARWDAVLLTDRVLTAAMRQQMWTPVRLNDGTAAPYGYGWHVESGRGRRRVWHGGGLPGFTSHYVRYLDDGLTVIVLSNGDDSDMGAIANGVAALYLERRSDARSNAAAVHGRRR
jgi:CubicO group peptidase (beta-lactamase class C family)